MQRCLASIPQRDDIQVIIVDDNSNEGVVDLNHFAGYSRKNTEIYLTKEGKGADAFSLWTQSLISTYIELFIRLAVIYFVLFISKLIVLTILVKRITNLFFAFSQ